MNLSDLGILALVEGVADILPIDSSAHSLLAARLLGWRAGPVAASLHFGAALALMTYFWRDMTSIAGGLWKLRKARLEPGTRLFGKMLLGATPIVLALSGVGGLAPIKLTDFFAVGVITLICGAVMLLGDRLSLTVKRIEHIGFGTSLAVGLAQLLSLAPGVGEVAVAVTMARLFGMERQAAYRFTLLVTLLVLLARALQETLLNMQRGVAAGLSDLLAGGVTYVLVLGAVAFGFSIIRRSGLMPFALYRLAFGLLLVGLGVLSVMFDKG